ncbi:hypothetical protein Bhyg_14468 [Pseudolycoriella hygida]|uniref:Uncharacterized protein n=1 Tax=Pseudolycoriella hygida TaxID=35572 RepID=A0A9Q0MQ00_9DIPT|nr:hypothetical protein Bhyg_14468 [Pseudolycoriella hygida]
MSSLKVRLMTTGYSSVILEESTSLVAKTNIKQRINSDDMEENPLDLWDEVTEQSFLEMEKVCESPRNRENDFMGLMATGYSFDNSRLSVVLEESSSLVAKTNYERSISSNDVRSGSSPSLKQSVYVDEEVLNIFPKKTRSRFFDYLESYYLESSDKNRKEIENLFSLMKESSDSSDDQSDLKLSSDGEAPDEFNDTLEAVNYFLRQGKKIMDKTLLQPCVSEEPK